MNENQTLTMLLKEAADIRGLSGRGLADLATANGYSLNRSTAARILSGSYNARAATETVRAIAWLAGVSERVAFQAAGRPQPGKSFAEELPEGADLLSPRERRAVLELVRVMIERREAEHEGTSATREAGTTETGSGTRIGAPIAAPTEDEQNNVRALNRRKQGDNVDGRLPAPDPADFLAAQTIDPKDASLRPADVDDESQDHGYDDPV